MKRTLADARARAGEWNRPGISVDAPFGGPDDGMIIVSLDASEGRVLLWGTPWSIPNMQVYVRPFSVYVRWRGWNLMCGRRFARWLIRIVRVGA